MKKRNVKVRLLSILLSAVMLIGILPVIPITISAADAAQTYVSLPITIRDYAADGMLFEFNQVGATGTTGSTTEQVGSFTASVNPSSIWNVSTSGSVAVYTKGNGSSVTAINWHKVFCNKDGSVSSVSAKGEDNLKDIYSRIPDDGYVVLVYEDYKNANSALSAITETTKGDYTVKYSGSTLTITQKAGDAYNQANTTGFSLLRTEDADYIKNLTDSSSIAGTTLIENGKWGNTTDPDPVSVTLNSGAKQEIFGALVRTDLVNATLVNGGIEYTEAAVTYLANYMQQIMAVPEKNSDGSYNTYFVTGHKLDDLGGSDLAAKIRAQVTGGLGTYADAKAKSPDEYTDITTWFDAAYFLLHNTFSDNVGYGKTVGEYKNLNLVQSTNSDGETCFVFNSGYDGAVYDYENGVIYNTQTETITIAKTNSGTEQYVRGNALPDARFDPLGMSGAGKNFGYGLSGDTYGDMVSESTADWNTFYDNTNYNLSLEGHAQFIYYHDDNLYFTFTGDDDVYLFINGVRVLDLGAAHSISKVKVSLNDVAELCGLEDGKAYDFDFFYMERHGTAANFGIETNIKIVNPSMLTQKTGYQFGAEVGYNGFVNPNEAVNYCFQLTNNGEAPLKQLEFLDEDIGVNITSTALSFNSETTVSDLLLALYAADGTVKKYIPKGTLTEDALKQALDEGIDIGERILIHGFKYTIPAKEWISSNGYTYFNNTVYTVGIAHYKNASTEILHGIADYRVQKPSYVFAGDHFYTVGELKEGSRVDLKANSTITGNVTEAEILEMVNAGQGAVSINMTSFDKIEICSPSGNTNASAILGSRASVSGKTIQYSTPVTGTDNFYFLVTKNENRYGPIRVTVYNYGWADNKYVIDYGLPVELNDTNVGITRNDELIEGNPHVTKIDIILNGATSNYGSFDIASSGSAYLFGGFSLKYTMSNIMSGVDSTETSFTLAEDGVTTPDNRTNGVTFSEKVEVAPASVMYYENDFEDINYIGNWEQTSSSAGTEQSSDQDANYGSDPNYAVSDAIASNGTFHKLTLSPNTSNQEVMYFDFIGTGFELISRATKDFYSILSVEIYEWIDETTEPEKSGIYYVAGNYNGDKDNTEICYPVITESEGGDAYEVPVIKIDDLPYSKYRVAIYTANSSASTNREVYIDGIRIYNPLSDEIAESYYSADEFGATYSEIRPLITVGNVAAYINITDGSIVWATGTTVVEDKGDDDENGVFQVSNGNIADYLQLGPNNELYLDAHANGVGENISLLAFYVTKSAGFDADASTIQIGVHRKISSVGASTVETGAVYLAYGSNADDIVNGIEDASGNTVNWVAVESGTEQYVTIDPANLTFDASGKALVMIGTFGGENAGANTLALTNLKIKGYDITASDDIAKAANGEPNTKMVRSAFALRYMLSAPLEEEPQIPETEPEVEPELPEVYPPTVNNIAMLNKNIKSGNSAIVTVEASCDTHSLVVLDENYNAVEYSVLTATKTPSLSSILKRLFGDSTAEPEDNMIYTIAIPVDGENGQNQSFYVF
ncbi:MAG: fibro-slime domain-containing protein, partial [Clostridia bacterium]|nr:fibro-slime domain-containing protein [Clostridia bacterium]